MKGQTWVTQTSCSNKSLYSVDPPGEAEVLMIEEVLLKGEDGHFECFLSDPGNPRTEQFLWRL